MRAGICGRAWLPKDQGHNESERGIIARVGSEIERRICSSLDKSLDKSGGSPRTAGRNHYSDRAKRTQIGTRCARQFLSFWISARNCWRRRGTHGFFCQEPDAWKPITFRFCEYHYDEGPSMWEDGAEALCTPNIL